MNFCQSRLQIASGREIPDVAKMQSPSAGISTRLFNATNVEREVKLFAKTRITTKASQHSVNDSSTSNSAHMSTRMSPPPIFKQEAKHLYAHVRNATLDPLLNPLAPRSKGFVLQKYPILVPEGSRHPTWLFDGCLNSLAMVYWSQKRSRPPGSSDLVTGIMVIGSARGSSS
jgi:hypothetical protein